MQTIELPDGAHYGRVVRVSRAGWRRWFRPRIPMTGPDFLAIREINTGAYCFDAAFLAEGLAKIPPARSPAKFISPT